MDKYSLKKQEKQMQREDKTSKYKTIMMQWENMD